MYNEPIQTSNRRKKMSKIHLRQGTDGTAACACKAVNTATGKVIRNSRSTYQQMSSVSVTPEEFRTANPADRCAHCCDRFTSVMNARRKLSGKPLYKDAMTKELA
jgi:hypothetical protein